MDEVDLNPFGQPYCNAPCLYYDGLRCDLVAGHEGTHSAEVEWDED